ncbi:hypothetical protein ACWD04_02705 [Streptomyces sp. NPDC002911]
MNGFREGDHVFDLSTGKEGKAINVRCEVFLVLENDAGSWQAPRARCFVGQRPGLSRTEVPPGYRELTVDMRDVLPGDLIRTASAEAQMWRVVKAIEAAGTSRTLLLDGKGLWVMTSPRLVHRRLPAVKPDKSVEAVYTRRFSRFPWSGMPR